MAITDYSKQHDEGSVSCVELGGRFKQEDVNGKRDMRRACIITITFAYSRAVILINI